MTDNENINVGDICVYSYADGNRSISIVEVVKDLTEAVAEAKFHQVIFDDSGNNFFTYLYNTGKTMNVSKCKLTKIDLINHQKAEIERLQKYNPAVAFKHYNDGITEFAERLKEQFDALEYCAKTNRKIVKVDELREQIDWILHTVVPKTVDQIAKETKGGE